MDIKLILGIIASITVSIGLIAYIIDILKKRTEPHIYTWLIWTILPIVGALSQLKDGAGYGSMGFLVASIFCGTIFILSFKYGTKNITKFDTYCLIASLIAIFFYVNIENPIWAIIAVSAIDFAGFLPTFRKIFTEPFSETPITYLLNTICNTLSIFALYNYSFTTTFYGIVLIFANFSLFVMIIFKRSKQKPIVNITKI